MNCAVGIATSYAYAYFRVPRHPNVITYYGAVQEENHFNIFMEHMAGNFE
jgi:hypothetical protein